MQRNSTLAVCLKPAAIAAVVLLAGCASTYQLTLMPRTSGKMYYGEATEQRGGGQADVTVNIDDRIYNGTWVPVTAARSTAYVTGGFGWGWGRRAGIGIGTAPVVIDNPEGASAKALLSAADGSGLRCDFKGLGSATAGGTCQDDKGLLYDVQIRIKQ